MLNVSFFAAADVAAAEIPNWFAVVMGVGTVFVGLLSIIIICVITGALCGSARRAENKKEKTVLQPKSEIKNRGEIIAAVCAACAEDMGKDVNALRVVSFKKI